MCKEKMKLTNFTQITTDQSQTYKSTYIIGYRNFQNDLLSYFLYSKSELVCISCEDVDCLLDIEAEKDGQKKLLLIDITAKNINKLLFELEDEYKSLFKSLKSTVEGISDKIKKDEAKKEHTASIYNKFVSIPVVFGAFALVYAGIVWIDASIERIEGIEEISENN